MKASKWLARWNYVFYITRNNWKNLGELAYIFANMQMFLYATDHMGTGSGSFLWPKWHFSARVSMIPDWQLNGDSVPTSPAKTNRHYVQLHQWNHLTWRHAYSSAQLLTAGWNIYMMPLALSSTYTVHPVAFTVHAVQLRGLHFFHRYLRSFICVLHAEGRARGGPLGYIVSIDNLYLFFCPGWKICDESLGFL